MLNTSIFHVLQNLEGLFHTTLFINIYLGTKIFGINPIHVQCYSHNLALITNLQIYKFTNQQLTGDEGFYLPNGKLLCLGNAQTIETVHEGQ